MVSFTGDGAARTALVLVTADRGSTAVALVLLASTLPRLLGPVAGAIADTVDRRRLMLIAELGQAAAMAVLIVGVPPMWALVLVVVVASSFATIFGPASSSSVPALVDADELPRANALIGTAFNFQIALGPVLAGLLVGLGGVRLTFALDVATFVLSAVLLTGLPRLVADRAAGPAEPLWASTVAGLRYVRHAPGPRSLVIGVLVFVAFAGLDNVAIVFLVRSDLHGSATVFGLVQGCFGVGMLLASVALSVRRRSGSASRLLVAGSATSVVGALVTAGAPDLTLAGGAQALAGVGNGLENVAMSTHVQRIVPAPMVGRVFGVVATAAQVGSSISYAAGGPLVAGIGARETFVIAGVGGIFGLALFVASLRTKPIT